jgi:hypothetical protein
MICGLMIKYVISIHFAIRQMAYFTNPTAIFAAWNFHFIANTTMAKAILESTQKAILRK